MREADTGQVLVRLVLEPDPEARPAEVDRLARQLHAELRQFDVEGIAPIGEAVPPVGSKSGAAAVMGEWLITLSASGGVLVSVVEGLKDWLARRPERSQLKVTIGEDSIELGAATAEEQAVLVDAFLAKHR